MGQSYPHKPVGLVIAVKTRWWSLVKQNKRFVRLKVALDPTLRALQEDDSIKEAKKVNFQFTANDWKVMEALVGILEPFKKAIKELEGSLVLLRIP